MTTIATADKGHHFAHRERRVLEQRAGAVEAQLVQKAAWRRSGAVLKQFRETRRRQADTVGEAADPEWFGHALLHFSKRLTDPRVHAEKDFKSPAVCA
jgi:hypothetical protein